METTRLSDRGQVILPKSIRDAHHWTPGTEFEIEDQPEGVLLRPKKQLTASQFKDVIGCTGYLGPAKSLQEMEVRPKKELVDQLENPVETVELSADERFAAMMEISRRCAALPELDPRSADEIIGYDENGIPR